MAEEDLSLTVSAYATFARAYADAQSALPDLIQEKIWMFAHLLGDQGRILEIGSGPGRDAVALEVAGLSVDRTDITPAFVELLREQGHDARVLDPLVDELGTGYDGVWAQACLLHVDRDSLGAVLTRLAAATRDKGVLYLSLKEGDGEEWSTHGSVGQPRRFVYWRESQLRDVLESAGWAVFQEIEHERHANGVDWLDVLAYRMPASLPEYRRPELPADEFIEPDGSMIRYGERWETPEGIDAPESSYSVTSHLERFAPLHDVVDALVACLRVTYDVDVSEVEAVARDDDQPTTAVRVTPRDPDAAPLTFWCDDFPGVRASAGFGASTRAPVCGCDACDETAAEGADDLESFVRAVVSGGLSEKGGDHRLVDLEGGREESSGSRRWDHAGTWHAWPPKTDFETPSLVPRDASSTNGTRRNDG